MVSTVLQLSAHIPLLLVTWHLLDGCKKAWEWYICCSDYTSVLGRAYVPSECSNPSLIYNSGPCTHCCPFLGCMVFFFSGPFLQLQQIFSDTLQRAVFVALHRLKLLFHRRYKEERYWVQFPPLFHDGYYSSPWGLYYERCFLRTLSR